MSDSTILLFNEELNHETDYKLPQNISLKDMLLPCEWVLYLYDKQLFKKMANNPNFIAKPHKEICTLKTLNDLIYLLQIMEESSENKDLISSLNSHKINLDMNDYIIMRKGIDPIWEHLKNKDGGAFTIKMNHKKGYDIWSTFLMYIVGETLCDDMHYINGMTVSYIADTSGTNVPFQDYTYLKIWDGKPNRTRDDFINILPSNLLDKIKNESIMYSQNNAKKHFGEKHMIEKLQYYENHHEKPERYGGFKKKRNYGVKGKSFRRY
jgi:hypothetical protein